MTTATPPPVGARPPAYRFRGPGPAGPAFSPTAEQLAVIDNRHRRLRVLAGPGTGKTATLVETVARRVEGGADPAGLLVVTFSRRAAAELAERIAVRLAVTTTEPLVRTLHGYAYRLVRARAAATGQAAPRLLSAGESDHIVRELLLGHAATGGAYWPPGLREALTSDHFAQEVRGALSRSVEAGMDSGRMAAWGRRRGRPEWVALARFADEYQQVADLQQASTGLGAALDQAELTRAALAALADPVMDGERRQRQLVYVDEYQDVDPAQAELLDQLAVQAREFIVVGDPDQSIYAFRGSDPGQLGRLQVDATVSLTVTRRLPEAVLVGSRRVAARLPGPGGHRALVRPAGAPDTAAAAEPDALQVVVLSSAGREAAFVADRLRRAHLLDQVPWSRMAVLVRSPVAALPALRRAFGSAGVPLRVGRADQPLLSDPTVAALLQVLRCGRAPALLTGQVALDLLASPLAGLDPMAVRRLRRVVRAGRDQQGSSADQVAALLAGGRADRVPADLAPAVARVRAALAAAARPGPAEAVLWRVWRSTGLGVSLPAQAEAGGRAGQRADHALDAVLALFAVASDLAVRLPLAGIESLVELVDGQTLPVGEPEAAGRGDAVSVLSAHAAKGLEWDVVVVAGVQEGTWPDLRARGSLLGISDLLDLGAGVPGGVDRSGSTLADERRLFYVAVTRARRAVICTAVADADVVPSRFLGELTGTPVEELATAVVTAPQRSLHLVDLVADLRRTVVGGAPALAAAASARLARLAAAGVRGADPDSWWGLPGSSTEAAPGAGAPVRVSPSAVQTLLLCPLRAVLDRRSGGRPVTEPQLEGIVVHALAQGMGLGLPQDEIVAELTAFVEEQTHAPPWQRRRLSRVLGAMVGAARDWAAATHPPRTLVGTEVDMDVELAPASPGVVDAAAAAAPVPSVRLAGRVDWLSRDADGALVITDFKTAASTPSRAETAAHPQLAAYQVAAAAGAFDGVAAVDGSDPDGAAGSTSALGAAGPGLGAAAPGSAGAEPDPAFRSGATVLGGAELVHLRGGSARTFAQAPLDTAAVEQWSAVIRQAALDGAGARPRVTDNETCERCPVRMSCPLHGGRQVTG